MCRGLVMEGGAMRGLFSAGVTDVFMENNIEFDVAIGVSAGAAFGCNIKSKQTGRALRYNTKYCRDKRYCSISSFLKTGDLFGADFCYRELPFELDLFDTKTYRENKMDFYVVSTDIEKGTAVYTKCDKGDGEDLEWFRASASMPLVSNIVRIGDKKLLDGGISDAIPIKFAESLGLYKNVIILTRPYDYVKKKNSAMFLVKRKYKDYPEFVSLMARRHEEYNKTIEYIKKIENEGKAIVIRPEKALDIGRIEKNPDKLYKAYEEGRKQAELNLEKIKKFV